MATNDFLLSFSASPQLFLTSRYIFANLILFFIAIINQLPSHSYSIPPPHSSQMTYSNKPEHPSVNNTKRLPFIALCLSSSFLRDIFANLNLFLTAISNIVTLSYCQTLIQFSPLFSNDVQLIEHPLATPSDYVFFFCSPPFPSRFLGSHA
jgi:hypothetical protein